ncbi:MAG: WD40 repeat domain-containing protein [Planctomycetota bacterium]|jgi:hypothetical protein
MKRVRSWAVCRHFLGALFVIAALGATSAQAQDKYKITQPGNVISQAQFTNRGNTLVIVGPLGRFVYKRDQSLDDGASIGYAGKREPAILRWPKTGTGPIYAFNAGDDDRGRWFKIGDVRPVPAKKAPAPDQFPKVSWPAHNSAILSLDIRVDGRVLASGDGGGVVKTWNLNTSRRLARRWSTPGSGVAFRQGGNLAAGGPNRGGAGAAVVIRANVNTPVPQPLARIDSLVYRWDGFLLAVGGTERHPESHQQVGAVRIFQDDNTRLFRLKTLYESAGAPVRSMAFTPNHEYLLTASGGVRPVPGRRLLDRLRQRRCHGYPSGGLWRGQDGKRPQGRLRHRPAVG